MDLVSIIIPVYNSEEFLRQCLDSVVNQTYRNLEIILINDGSTDKSCDICEEYSTMDSRIILVSKANTGVSDSRNVGIEISTGKYICFIDSDDIVDSQYITKLVSAMLKDDYDIVLCNIKDIYKNRVSSRAVNAPREGIFYEEYGNLIKITRVPFVKLYKSNIIKSNNITFKTDISYMEDQIFNFQYFRYVNRYFYIDESMYNYFHRNNLSLSRRITITSFKGNVEKLKYASQFYYENNIKNAGLLLNQQVLFCMDKFVKLANCNDNYTQFKDRVELLKLYVDFNEDTKSFKRKIALWFLKHSIIFPFYVKGMLKRMFK